MLLLLIADLARQHVFVQKMSASAAYPTVSLTTL
jgi:hypothetical protein